MRHTRRKIVNDLLYSNRGMQKKAFLFSALTPINATLAGEALASRIAPLGNNRTISDFGRNLLDGVVGAGAGAGTAMLAGASTPMAINMGAAGGVVGAALSGLYNAPRANKYLELALKGPNRLNKQQLVDLLEDMSPSNQMFGSDNIFEYMGGNDARIRLRRAIREME